MNNKPFFGFLDTLDENLRAKALKHLTGLAIGRFENFTTGSAVVEEIIRRNGTFLTAKEAKTIAPFVIEYDDAFFAHFPAKESDTSIGPDGTRWRSLDVIQYCYGLYLQNLIATNKLQTSDVHETAMSYI